jgi:hypothetical protein
MSFFQYLTFLKVLLIAPVIEEFVFRYWLKQKNEKFSKVSLIFFWVGIPIAILAYLFRLDLHYFIYQLTLNSLYSFFISINLGTEKQILSLLSDVLQRVFAGYILQIVLFPFVFVMTFFSPLMRVLNKIYSVFGKTSLGIISTTLFVFAHIQQIYIFFGKSIFSGFLSIFIYLLASYILYIVRMKYTIWHSIGLHTIINSPAVILHIVSLYT